MNKNILFSVRCSEDLMNLAKKTAHEMGEISVSDLFRVAVNQYCNSYLNALASHSPRANTYRKGDVYEIK